MTAAEAATLDWINWWKTKPLHGGLGYRTPAEAASFYTHPQATAPV